MSRRVLSTAALITLLALTAATWSLHAQGGGARAVAAVAVAKAAVILWVFLELDRAWKGWMVVALLLVGAIGAATALLMGG